MLSEITFVAKIHTQNGISFYLPTKLVKWLGLNFPTYNNTVYIRISPDSEETRVDCTATRHRETWKFSFYSWDMKGLKVKTDYLFRIPIGT